MLRVTKATQYASSVTHGSPPLQQVWSFGLTATSAESGHTHRALGSNVASRQFVQHVRLNCMFVWHGSICINLISTLCVAFSTVEGHSVTVSHFIITFSTFNTVFYYAGNNVPRWQLLPAGLALIMLKLHPSGSLVLR